MISLIKTLKVTIMLIRLYNQLVNFKLQYHELRPLADDTILLLAKTLEPEGIDEVMEIKKLADGYNLITTWDGKHIEIAYKEK